MSLEDIKKELLDIEKIEKEGRDRNIYANLLSCKEPLELRRSWKLYRTDENRNLSNHSLGKLNDPSKEIRPGVEVLRKDYKDSAYSAYSDRKEKLTILEEETRNQHCGEFEAHNWKFWGLMFAAVIISILFYIPIHYSCKKISDLIFIGFVLFYFLTAFIAYYNYKNKNGRNFRYASLFCMIIIWISSLWWIIQFIYHNKPRDAVIPLLLAIIMLIIWIGLNWNKGKNIETLLLLLALIWLIYVLFFNLDNLEDLKDCNDCNHFKD